MMSRIYNGHSSSEARPLGMQATPEINPHVWNILLRRFDHGNISMAILSLPLIKFVRYWQKNVSTKIRF